MLNPNTTEAAIWPAKDDQNSAANTETELRQRMTEVSRKALVLNLSRTDPNIIFPKKLATPITLSRRLVCSAEIPNFCSALSVMKE